MTLFGRCLSRLIASVPGVSHRPVEALKSHPGAASVPKPLECGASCRTGVALLGPAVLQES